MKKILIIGFLLISSLTFSQGFYKRVINHQGSYLNDTTSDTNHYSILYARISVDCKAYHLTVAGNAIPKFVQDGWYFSPTLATALTGLKLYLDATKPTQSY
jgi:hypothetical protein